MTTIDDISFWERIPFPERARLLHFLITGVKKMRDNFNKGAWNAGLAGDILDVAADVSMSLWDYERREAQ